METERIYPISRFWTFAFWFWTAFLFTLTSYPELSVPTTDRIGLDKVAHFILYSVFAYTFMRMRGLELRTFRNLFLLMLIVPIFDETHQLFIPGRSFSWLDWSADILGMGIIALVFRAKCRRLEE
jgi:VanZ family protein